MKRNFRFVIIRYLFVLSGRSYIIKENNHADEFYRCFATWADYQEALINWKGAMLSDPGGYGVDPGIPVAVRRRCTFAVLAVILLSIAGFVHNLKFYLIILTQMPVLFGIILAILAALFLFVVLLVLRDRFTARFSLNVEGASVEATEDSRRLNRWIVYLALLLGSPAALGSGLLAQSGENTFIAWPDVFRADFDEKRRIITLRNTWRPVVRLYCGPEQYPQAVQLVEYYMAQYAEDRAENFSAGARLLPRRLATVCAVWTAAVFLLAYPSSDLRFPAAAMILLLVGAAFSKLTWRRRFAGAFFVLWSTSLFLALLEGIRKAFNLYRPDSTPSSFNLQTGDQAALLTFTALGAFGLLAIALWLWKDAIDRS